MTHVKSLLLKRSVTGQEDFFSPSKRVVSLCTVHRLHGISVGRCTRRARWYGTLMLPANSRHDAFWVHRLARFNVQNLRKYSMINPWNFWDLEAKSICFFFPLSHLFGWKIIQWMENFCKSYCRQRRRHRGMPKNCYQTRLGRKRSRRRTFWDRRKSTY